MNKIIMVVSLCLLAYFVRCTRSSGSNYIDTGFVSDEVDVEQRTFIEKDQANRMIGSYLKSIDYPEKDNQVRSLSLNADSLRLYLQDTSIKKIKVIVAHNMDYILSGFEGKVPAPGQFATTFIVVGINSFDKIVYSTVNRVMDNAAPCPQMCSFDAVDQTGLLE